MEDVSGDSCFSNEVFIRLSGVVVCLALKPRNAVSIWSDSAIIHDQICSSGSRKKKKSKERKQQRLEKVSCVCKKAACAYVVRGHSSPSALHVETK